MRPTPTPADVSRNAPTNNPRARIIEYMTITPNTIAPRTVTDPPVTPGPVGTLREASAASEADHLFAEGIALLDAGDHLAAAEKVWHLHRKLLDIIDLRTEELGISKLDTPENPNPIADGYSAGNMLETHVHHHGHFLDLESTRQEIQDTRPLLDFFRLD